MNRWYGWKLNPLYHSGAITVLMMAVMLVTGLYLVIFYRIGTPYESVRGLAEQAVPGAWMRSVHRYAADVAVVAALVHAVRMFVQGRTWGPRALAWVSGLVLLFVTLVCGWTGYVMVWDTQGQLLALEGARMLDAVPLFTEPITRTFVGDRPLPRAFFFLNLFLHVALPVGVALLLWVHVSRVARAALLPPKHLTRWLLGLLAALALVWPAALGPEASPFRIPADVPLDLFYAFWLPFSRSLPPWVLWAVLGGCATILLSVPIWTRPRADRRPPPSEVEHRFCTGCEQCYVDCPYEAISMVSRTDDRPTLVASVDPALCVSCGICAGSCAPMGVGPPGRTGRDQLVEVRSFVAMADVPGSVVIVGCTRGAGRVTDLGIFDGAPVLPVTCVGNLHTSAVEYLVRAGAHGVLLASCPPRDCWSREGPRWLIERLYHDREAELKERVDRRRVRVIYAAEGERSRVAAALESYRTDLDVLAVQGAEADIDLDLECVLPDSASTEGEA